MLEEIVSLYEAYLEEFRRLERNRRPMEGVFGIGNGPQNYPCHGKFAQDLERMLKDLSAQALSFEQAGQVLRYIYCTAPVRWESVTTVYWMLLAVHGLTGKVQAEKEIAAKHDMIAEAACSWPAVKNVYAD